MKSRKRQLAMKGMFAALRIRRDAGVGLDVPLSIHDFVEQRGIDLWFSEVPSLEGLYSASASPIIILNSARPEGRKSFTCAHEFGHHVFGHGTIVDTDGVGMYSDLAEEFLADCFAGFLLMPKASICKAFFCRGWDFRQPTPVQAYCIANLFGVGYTSLIQHMHSSLGLLGDKTANMLLDTHLPEIRVMLGAQPNDSLIVVDKHWVERPVDLSVADRVIVPREALIEGGCLVESATQAHARIIEATSPGVGKLALRNGSWSVFVRISRKAYTGRSMYRFLEAADDECA